MKINEMNLAELKALEQQLKTQRQQLLDEVKALEEELSVGEAIRFIGSLEADIGSLLEYKIDLEHELEMRYGR